VFLFIKIILEREKVKSKGQKIDTMKRCSYTWKQWDRKRGDNVIQCSEETWEGSGEFCIFHDPSPEKDADLFKKMLKEQMQTETRIHRFIGYHFPRNWDFSGNEFGFNVYFNGASFGEDASFSKASFQRSADFSDVTFQGDANFRGATFQKAKFSGTVFYRKADFNNVTFQEDVDFSNTTFQKDVDFYKATFQEIKFNFSNFHENADFNQAVFQKNVNFYKITFHSAIFNRVIFQEDVNFGEAVFQEDVDFNEAIFRGRASFYNTIFHREACFWGVTFESHSCFNFAAFQGDADFWGANFREVEFSGSIFHKNAKFRDVAFQGDADFKAVIARESFDLVSKQVSSILDFRGAKFFFVGSVTANLKKARFYRTHLQNVAFVNCSWPKNSIIYEEKEMKDTGISFKELETIYRDLKRNMQNHGDHSKAGEFYYREMEMRRKGAAKIRERLGFKVYKSLAGYGERYWNTAAISGFIILFFAFLYGISDCLQYSIVNPCLYQEIVDVVYFSFVTFTTLGLGDITPLTTLGKILICLEAVIGAFMIALFVVVFVRKMAR